MVEELNYKISSKSLYISVLQDRKDVKTKLKKLLGIHVPEIEEKYENDYSYSDDDDISYTYIEEKNNEKTVFNISIPYKKFEEFEPLTVVYKNNAINSRSYNVLKQNTWSDIINDAFIEKYKLPCNFIYKNCKVRKDINRSKYFLTFIAKCKDDGCDLFGWSEKKPDVGQPLELKILAKDTRGDELIHKTKRPLKGTKRKIVGQQLLTDIASNWRRNNVIGMEFGQTSPPNLYQSNVLRKAKQQYNDSHLGITIKNPIESLVELKRNSRFAGSIHTIGIDPFLVHYWTGHQLIIYKDECKKYCRVSVDATGGIVKKIQRSSLNLPSAHIFLYEAVINTSAGQIPITQMISEKQDTLSIFNWIAQWMRCAIQVPNEAICDYSFAILGAMAMAFSKNSGIKSYVDQCFGVAIGSHKNLPKCYIRIDVAHIIKIFCRNKHLEGKKNWYLKQFYVRGMRLLISATNTDRFKNVLTALITVMLSEIDGWMDNQEENPSESSRKYLLKMIKGNIKLLYV